MTNGFKQQKLELLLIWIVGETGMENISEVSTGTKKKKVPNTKAYSFNLPFLVMMTRGPRLADYYREDWPCDRIYEIMYLKLKRINCLFLLMLVLMKLFLANPGPITYIIHSLFIGVTYNANESLNCSTWTRQIRYLIIQGLCR